MGKSTAFFHERKRDLIRNYFSARAIPTRALTYLDLGCGKGELAGLLTDDFARTCGCDPSPGMLRAAQGVETRVQPNPEAIPYPDAEFDFVSAVCVYHHVPPHSRANLTAEVRRVLKPGGTFVIIEHNPYNPVTRAIVSRTPVDADAILLNAAEARRLLVSRGFSITKIEYFLYLPEKLYRKLGALEWMLANVPLGGQFAVFSQRFHREASIPR